MAKCKKSLNINSPIALVRVNATMHNAELDIALREFVSSVGSEVLGAMLIYRSGFIISSVARGGIDVKSLGAVVAAVKGSVDRLLTRSGIGSTGLILFTAGNYLIALLPINNDVILVSLAHKDSNIGLILMGLDYAKERIGKIMYANNLII